MEHSFEVRKEATEEKTNDVMNHEIDLHEEGGELVLYCNTHNMYLVGIHENEIAVYDDSCICKKGASVPLIGDK